MGLQSEVQVPASEHGRARPVPHGRPSNRAGRIRHHGALDEGGGGRGQVRGTVEEADGRDRGVPRGARPPHDTGEDEGTAPLDAEHTALVLRARPGGTGAAREQQEADAGSHSRPGECRAQGQVGLRPREEDEVPIEGRGEGGSRRRQRRRRGAAAIVVRGFLGRASFPHLPAPGGAAAPPVARRHREEAAAPPSPPWQSRSAHTPRRPRQAQRPGHLQHGRSRRGGIRLPRSGEGGYDRQDPGGRRGDVRVREEGAAAAEALGGPQPGGAGGEAVGSKATEREGRGYR
mmetsp:Transcript_49454/g.149037  ORF Transcript_49454/g.149037 Transcript_49454/m.149037 type:complete len:289 (+) Transcript_49454:343-1209(+)